jgi:dihydropteroate synthase
MGRGSLVMGILNTTPDSFSDGGAYATHAQAVERALAMARDGAAIIDVGGESTRPGSREVPEEEELRRTIPVIRAIRARRDLVISIDTRKAEVARQAIAAGARIVNDVSALRHDPEMMPLVRDTGAGVVLMHMQGDPASMQDAPRYRAVVEDVHAFLAERAACCEAHGIRREAIAVDPGIGFGKSVEHNLALIRGLRRLRLVGRPLLVGLSRKRFLGSLTGRETDERLAAGLAANVVAILNGADVLRVHDVKETCDAARIADILAGTDE